MASLLCGYLHVILKYLKAAPGLYFTLHWLIVAPEGRSVNSRRAAELEPWHFLHVQCSGNTSAHIEGIHIWGGLPSFWSFSVKWHKKADQKRQTDLFVNGKATFPDQIIYVKGTRISCKW